MGELGGTYVQVPKGHVWLEGDNILSSNDSRFYGPVPEASLKGRVLARVIAANSHSNLGLILEQTFI